MDIAGCLQFQSHKPGNYCDERRGTSTFGNRPREAEFPETRTPLPDAVRIPKESAACASVLVDFEVRVSDLNCIAKIVPRSFQHTSLFNVNFKRNAAYDELIAVLELTVVGDRSIIDEGAVLAAQVANAHDMIATVH